jgi:hypothetical protein
VALPVWAGAKAAAPAIREAMMADFILTVLIDRIMSEVGGSLPKSKVSSTLAGNSILLRFETVQVVATLVLVPMSALQPLEDRIFGLTMTIKVRYHFVQTNNIAFDITSI